MTTIQCSKAPDTRQLASHLSMRIPFLSIRNL
jgi:hypothetical protein